MSRRLFRFIALIYAAFLQLAAQPVQTAEAQHWEYKTVHSDAELNGLANAGWVFVSMASDQQGQHYLMRKVVPSETVNPTIQGQGRTTVAHPKLAPKALRGRDSGHLVRADGKAANVRVVKALDPGLDEAAVAAVNQWRSSPAKKAGSAD